MRFRTSLIAIAVAAALPSLASAVDFSYSGFSTAAYSQSDTDDAQVGYVSQPEGIDEGGSFETDSKVGVQVTAKFNEIVSATVQGVAYSDLAGDFEPRLDWAYVRVQPLSSLSMRAGYMRAPTFMYSDSVFVGYANTWVRPPLEVYNLLSVYQMRGVDVTWRGNAGPVAFTVNPYYGDSEVDLSTFTLDIPEWKGLALTAEYRSLTVRASYSQFELGTGTPALAPLVAGLRAASVVCAPCGIEAGRLDMDGTKVDTLSVGAQYDDGTNLVMSEYASSDSGGNYLLPESEGAYATYGRRFGGFMPYATVATLSRDTATQSIIPAGPFSALAGGVNAILSRAGGDQDSYSAGVRYDLPSFAVFKGALVKLQFDHIDADGNGMLNNVQPAFDGQVNMLSVSFDAVF